MPPIDNFLCCIAHVHCINGLGGEKERRIKKWSMVMIPEKAAPVTGTNVEDYYWPCAGRGTLGSERHRNAIA